MGAFTDKASGRLSVGLMTIAAMAVLAAPAEPASQPTLPRWRVMPIRSQAEHEQGLIGGEAEQHPQGITRSRSNPDRIYLSHDVGQIWRSDDNGRTWDRTLGAGMFVTCGQSVEVDPAQSDVVLAIVDSAWSWYARQFEGVYRSTDAGRTWQLVLATQGKHQRFYQHNLAYDPTTVDSEGAARWYAAFPGNGLFRSPDSGLTWRKVANLAGHARVYAIHAHPDDGQTVYVATSKGLMISRQQGADLQPWGDLPDGEVPGIALHPTRPSGMYAAVSGKGLFYSEDGGRTFELRKSFDATGVFINPGHPNVVYLVGNRTNSMVSTDSAKTWTELTVRPAPGLDRAGTWKTTIAGPFTGIVPDPRGPAAAVAFSHATLWRSESDPAEFADSSTLFTGYAWGWWNAGVIFDPTDPNRFRLLCCDIGSVETRNGGRYFTRHRIPWRWYAKGDISWTGMYAGDVQPGAGSEVLITSVGMYFSTKLVRSADAGATWVVVDDRTQNHLFIRFHPDAPNVVYAGNKRSTDGGKTFRLVEGLVDTRASIVGMVATRPDTIYAISRSRTQLLRSDDRGDTWRLYVEPGWRFNGQDSKPTFAAHPTDPHRIYTLDAAGDLAEFDGCHWRSLGVLAMAGAGGPRNFVVRIAFDPRHANILYAATHTAGKPFLFRSTDGGDTWLDITVNLPRIGAGGLVVSPHTGDVLIGSACGTRIFPPPYDSPNALYRRLPDDWRTDRRAERASR